MIGIYINDYKIQRRTILSIDSADMERVVSVWEDGDTLLEELQSSTYFEGRTRWCQLDIDHWRLMICRNLTIVSNLTDAEKLDSNNPSVNSLIFLISCLIHRLQLNGSCLIETLHINRADDYEVGFDYLACLTMGLLSGPRPKDKDTGFKLVVDNEDQDHGKDESDDGDGDDA